jgi:hypothetical protein
LNQQAVLPRLLSYADTQCHPAAAADGDGGGVSVCCSNEALHIADHELQMFLRTLHKQLETVALHPNPAYMVRMVKTAAAAAAEQAAAAGQ